MKWRVELSDDEVRATLEFLEVQRAAPSRQFLARLQRAYKVRVPWETASRVVRASEVRELEERPRRPPEFWALAMEQGSGGTCFESNYAFWALLRGLGFEVALHVNDMPQDQLIACHSSLVVAVDGERYLADVGMGMQLVALAPAWEIGAVAARARGLEAAASVPAGPEMARVEERRVPGPAGDVPVRVYWPSEAVGLPILVWFHGGGWVLGSVAESEPVCRRLAERAGVIVVSVEYRMAPEDPAPASFDDCYAATVWASEQAAELGGDARRLAVSGASAGANLAAAVALHARDAGGPAIAHQLLAYPVTDSRMDSASYSELATGFGLGRDAMRWFWDCYVPEGGAVSREDVRVSPAHAKDLSGLPSAQVITAEYDPLRDEGEAYAARLRGSGVEVRAERVAGQLHGFFSRPYVFDAGEQAVTDASEELKRVFALIAAGSAGSDGSAEAPKVAESGDTPKEAGESGGGVLSLGWWARRLGIGNRRTRP